MSGKLLWAVTAVGMALVFACGEASDEQEQSPSPSRSVAGPEHWRLVITRANGAIETIPSLDQPIICGSEDGPRILFFCGRTVGETPGPFWDFLPVNIDAGDTYTIETPAGFTTEPTPTTATPTPASP